MFILYYRPQRSCAKVIFLHVSVILSTGGGGWGWRVCPITCWDIPPDQKADTPDQKQTPPDQKRHPQTKSRHTQTKSRHSPDQKQTPLIKSRHPPDQKQTPPRSKADTPPRADTPDQKQTPPDQEQTPPWIQLTSGRYASYWNAFLFFDFSFAFVPTRGGCDWTLTYKGVQGSVYLTFSECSSQSLDILVV